MQRRIAASIAAIAAIGLLAASSSASAQTTSCRASAARVTLGPQNIEPFVANSPSSPCASQTAGLIPLPTAIGPLAVQVLYADTFFQPFHHNAAAAGVANAVLLLPGLGLSAAALTSNSDANCPPAVTTGSSQVLGLVINGRVIANTNKPQTISLGPLGNVFLNRTIAGPGNSITVRALEVDITGVGSVVVAESHSDDTC